MFVFVEGDGDGGLEGRDGGASARGVFAVIDDGEIRFGVGGDFIVFGGDDDVKGNGGVVGGAAGDGEFVILLIELVGVTVNSTLVAWADKTRANRIDGMINKWRILYYICSLCGEDSRPGMGGIARLLGALFL